MLLRKNDGIDPQKRLGKTINGTVFVYRCSFCRTVAVNEKTAAAFYPACGRRMRRLVPLKKADDMEHVFPVRKVVDGKKVWTVSHPAAGAWQMSIQVYEDGSYCLLHFGENDLPVVEDSEDTAVFYVVTMKGTLLQGEVK